MKQFIEILRRIDGRGYPAYKELGGRRFTFPLPHQKDPNISFTLSFDHIQGDPFAAPSRIRVRVDQGVAGFPSDTYSNRSRAIALQDLLLRVFNRASKRFSRQRGTGRSGEISAYSPSQEIIERSACQVEKGYVEMRFYVGLPAAGRRILAKEAEEIFVQSIPAIVQEALLFRSLDRALLYKQIETNEDADFIRASLKKLGLVAFVADGSILPRRSGIDDRPLEGGIPFRSPDSLRIEIKTPNRGVITGMGIPEGVTLIVGGGFHGKSTLLRAIERGVYNHIPGDGREFVITDPTAVKNRAEDGRSIAGIDISPFIGKLPGGTDTSFFTTQNASGSTSQAANIIEAIEAGSRLLLLDEDTSATNFMIRDERMQRLIEKRHEPITPFIDRGHQLYKDHGVSTILVMGGSGDYFDVADTVIAMVEYEPEDVTQDAREIAERFPTRRKTEGGGEGLREPKRIPLPESIDPRKGRKNLYLKHRGRDTLIFGRHEIDLSYVEQLIEHGQVIGIGYAIQYGKERYIDGKHSLQEIIGSIDRDIDEKGIDIISKTPHPADLARFRPQELAAAINRLRSLRIKNI